MCACPERQNDRDLCWGPDFRRGGDVLCVWERYTLHSACAWEREMPGDLAREWGKRCVHAQETK